MPGRQRELEAPEHRSARVELGGPADPGLDKRLINVRLDQRTLAKLCESIDYGYTASAVQDKVGPKFLRITDIVPDVIGLAIRSLLPDRRRPSC